MPQILVHDLRKTYRIHERDPGVMGALRALVPWGIAGFVINLITGALFFVGAPEQYASGGWGPQSAYEMIARDGRQWRRP